MLSVRTRARLKSSVNRLGIVVMRFPSPRLFEGHTKLMLEDLRIDCVLDVGANTGQYATMLRRLGYRGEIVSFEPVASTYRELTEAASSDARWHAVQVALGAMDGTAEINVTRGSDMASLLDALPAGDAPLSETREVVCVEPITTRRLDSIWSELPGSANWSRVFLKLDTQGYDLEVLKGGVETIDPIVALQSEVSVIPVYRGMPTWLDSFVRFSELGFEPTGIFPVTVEGPRAVEFDCVMVRRGVKGRRVGAEVNGGRSHGQVS